MSPAYRKPTNRPNDDRCLFSPFVRQKQMIGTRPVSNRVSEVCVYRQQRLRQPVKPFLCPFRRNNVSRYAKEGRSHLHFASARDDATRDGESQTVVSGEYMEDIILELAIGLVERSRDLPPGEKWLVGVAGPPGGGKSTLAAEVCQRVNDLCAQDGYQVAMVVPMDGFHYYRRELDEMEDPVLAHARRGAYWTFNAQAFVDGLKSIKENRECSFPSFDHGVGDPVEDDIEIDMRCKVILVEGNYLLLDIDPWSYVRDLLDERWFASCPLDVANQRVYERHVATGKPPNIARTRVLENDGPNGELIQGTKKFADVIISTSVPFRSTSEE